MNVGFAFLPSHDFTLCNLRCILQCLTGNMLTEASDVFLLILCTHYRYDQCYYSMMKEIRKRRWQVLRVKSPVMQCKNSQASSYSCNLDVVLPL